MENQRSRHEIRSGSISNEGVALNYSLMRGRALKDRTGLVLAELKKSEEAATNSGLPEIINLIAVTLNGIKGVEIIGWL